MAYTIQNFWEPRLANVEGTNQELISGWSYWNDRLAGFVEAPLTLSNEFSCDTPPEHSSIILVSAPGAVGKTTLAREVARITQAIYVDLSKAEPVAGNTLTGGLVNSNVFMEWKAQTTTVLIDGLDEARFRTTWEGFKAFLADLAARSRGRNLPTILFGRTVAIQDAYLVLDDIGSEVSILEIGYYDARSAIEFIMNGVKIEKKGNHEDVERKAAESILAQLREQTESDGDRFSGYAPVLQSIATHISGHNPSKLLSDLDRGVQPMTLQDVIGHILERESQKLRNLPFADKSLTDRLYLPGEQLDHLVSHLYGTPKPDIPVMNPDDAQIYDEVLKTWILEHPFLSGTDASSSVFEAVIGGHALVDPRSSETARRRYLSLGDAVNPFLCEFYPPRDKDDVNVVSLRPEHIGIVYASYRAQLSIGDSTNLLMEEKDAENQADKGLYMQVEMNFHRGDANRSRVVRFESTQAGTVYLGKYADDVEITAPHVDLHVGDGREAVFIAPVNVTCSNLILNARRIIVEGSSKSDAGLVLLEAEKLTELDAVSAPLVRSGVKLSVWWPGVHRYPWNLYAGTPFSADDPQIDEALRRLSKFVVSFRSHGKGALARYQKKLEHARMTKGAGQAVLDQMLKEEIVYMRDSMYFLNSDKLSLQVGVTYHDCANRNFGDKAIAFAKRALNIDDEETG